MLSILKSTFPKTRVVSVSTTDKICRTLHIIEVYVEGIKKCVLL